MDTDLILKYRPRIFDDFWNQSGPVVEIPSSIREKCLPKSMIHIGERGTGKTSLAEVTSMAISCLDMTTVEPCYRCEGCRLADTRLFCTGGRLFLHASNIQPDLLARFKWEVTYMIPPAPYDAWVAVIDEAHLMDRKTSNILLSFIETTKHCHFIFTTTELSGIDRAIQSRSQEYYMPLPTVEETFNALSRICATEELPLSKQQLYDIAERNECIPRDCLKIIQRYKGTRGKVVGAES